MVTIDDIAAKAGLSRSSVAKILRDRPGFSPKTRQRVLGIASDMGYRPNYLSKALAGGRSMTIGIIAGGLRVPITTLKLSSIEKVAAAAGYMAFMRSLSLDALDLTMAAIRDMADRRVDGMIVYASAMEIQTDLASMLDTLGLPVVLISDALCGRPAVVVNREAGIRQAVAHLVELGHRRAALMATTHDLASPARKYNVYRKAGRELGLALEDDTRWTADSSTSGVKSRTYEIVRRQMARKDRPTALLMNNDDCAMAALAALTDMGLRVPEDVSIVGFDDLPHTRYLRPALTTIHQPRAEVGQTAFALLHQWMQRLAGANASDNSTPAGPARVMPPDPIVMDCHLVVRQTTAAPRPMPVPPSENGPPHQK